MRVLRRLFPWIFLLLTAAVVLFFMLRRDTRAAYGTAVALCPGPDLYGYTCDSGTAFAYIDAATDTRLFADDGIITLALPFPFTFYGTTYTEVQVSSNGNLQFGSSAPFFENVCLDEAPARGLGDMIAPFWDDLNLTNFGEFEYDVVGEAPERILVLEWDDVPRFGDQEDRVTFAVQLFEGSQDILFLYEDVTMLEGNNGSSATIGIQSEAQGLALQFGCNQPVVADASRVRFAEPAVANAEIGLETAVSAPPFEEPLYAKGEIADLLNQLNLQGPGALPDRHSRWLNQSPPRTALWQWLDLTGDGMNELLLLRHGTAQHPELSDLTLFSVDEAGLFALLHYQPLTRRQQPVVRPVIATTVDLTQDDLTDVVVQDEVTGRTFVLTVGKDGASLLPLPGNCRGSLGVFDLSEDGILEVVRDGCEANGRFAWQWNGSSFARLP